MFCKIASQALRQKAQWFKIIRQVQIKPSKQSHSIIQFGFAEMKQSDNHQKNGSGNTLSEKSCASTLILKGFINSGKVTMESVLFLLIEKSPMYMSQEILKHDFLEKISIKSEEVHNTQLSKLFTSKEKMIEYLNRIPDIKAIVERSLLNLQIDQDIQPRFLSEVWISIGDIFVSLGDYNQALQYYGMSNQQNSNFEFYKRLIKVYLGIGEPLRAYELCKQIISQNLSMKNFEKCEYFRCFGNIAHTIRKYDEAENHYKQAIEIGEVLFQNNDLQLISLYNDLGALFSDCDEPEKALNTFHRLEKLIKHNYGINHPALSDCYNNIASTLIDLQRFKEAKKYIKEDEKIIISNFGISHLSLATTYTNMGCISQKLQQSKKALTYFKKAYEVLLQNGLTKHSDAAKVLLCLGNCNMDEQKIDAALEYFTNAQNILLKSGLMDQPLYSEINISIASIWEQRQDWPQAIQHMDNCMRQYNLCQNLKGISYGYNKMGLYHTYLDQSEVALDYFLKAFNLSSQINGIESEETLMLAYNIGVVCNKLNQYHMAIDYLTLVTKGNNLTNIDLNEVHQTLAEVYSKVGEKFQASSDLRRSSLKQLNQVNILYLQSLCQ